MLAVIFDDNTPSSLYKSPMQNDWEQLHARLVSVLGDESLDEQLWQDIEELSFEGAQGVIWRAEALVAQLAEMKARNKTAIFFRPFRPGASAEDRCWLCSEDLPSGEPWEYFRCSTCAMAVRLILWHSICVYGATTHEKAASSQSHPSQAGSVPQLL